MLNVSRGSWVMSWVHSRNTPNYSEGLPICVLAQRKANDLAEAERAEEELKLKEEMVRWVVEQEEKERQERLREMERQRDKITVGERMLAAQKQALLKVESVMGKVNDNDVDNNVASQSTISEQTVSNCLLMICTTLTVNSNRAPPRRSQSASLMWRPAQSWTKLSTQQWGFHHDIDYYYSHLTP